MASVLLPHRGAPGTSLGMRQLTCTGPGTVECDHFPVLSDYGMQPLSGIEFGGMLCDLIRVPHAAAMLAPISPALDPVALGSVSDNVLDGYRAVAPHLAELPGAEVLVVSHGLKSVPLYAVQAGIALGAARVDFASDDDEALALAERLGARPVRTDFGKTPRRYPIVVDAGVTPAGLRYAVRSTAPEGICHSVSFYAGDDVPLPLGPMYFVASLTGPGGPGRSARAHPRHSLHHRPCPRRGAAPRSRAADRAGTPAARGGHDARRRLGGRAPGVPGARHQADRAPGLTSTAFDGGSMDRHAAPVSVPPLTACL